MIQTLYGHGYRFIAPVMVRDTATPGEHARAPLAQEQTEAGSPPSVPLQAGEQKLVTILCCGVAQATAQPGPPPLATLHRLLWTLHTLAWPEVQGYAGTLLLLTGDCVLAVFGVPVAHEDHAHRAVLAALAVPSAPRELSPFVGRARELSLLQALLERVEEGQGQVVGIIGEPGLGKSRLIYEFRRGLRGRRLTYLAGTCRSYGQATPYLPVLTILRHLSGVTAADPPVASAAKVHRRLAEVDMAPEEYAPYLLRLLDMPLEPDPQHFLALQGLWQFYVDCGALPTARELGEQLLQLAQREGALTPRLVAHDALGTTFFILGDYAAARTHCEQAIALIDPVAERTQTLCYGLPPEVRCLTVAALTLWCLGYPTQAVRRSQEALVLAKTLAPPQSLTFAQHWAALLHHHLHEAPAVQAQANALLALAMAQEFQLFVGLGTCWQGWALAVQSQIAEGLHLLTSALTAFEATGRGDMLAEAYRLQGAFLLRQTTPDTAEAEARFQQALAIARRQQAKSWELRAAMSLSRLWQRQGKRIEAQHLLAEVYGWFTEGFGTADLQEAQALLEAMS